MNLQQNDSTAIIEFDKIKPNILDLTHTEVPEELSENGVASKLVVGSLQYVKDNHLKLIASCPFIAKYISKHFEWNDLIVKSNS